MPSPNGTPATAIELGPLPNSFTDIVDIVSLWYKYTTQPNDELISFFIWNVTDSLALFDMYDGLAAANALSPIYSSGDSPINWVPEAGHVYYFNIFAFTNPSSLDISVQSRQPLTVPIGSFVIPNDKDNQPVVFVNSTNGAILGAVNPYAVGEASQVLTNGISLSEQFVGRLIKIYDNQQNEIFSGTWADWTSGRLIINNIRVSPFYIASRDSGKVTTISETGIFGPTTWTIPIGINSMGVSMDGSKLYYSDTFALNTPIKAWDLVGNISLGTLIPGTVGFYTDVDLLVMTDGTIIVPYVDAAFTILKIKSFTSLGALINTVDIPLLNPTSSGPRIAYGVDDLTSFWAWTHPISGTDARSRFREYRVSDFALLNDKTSVEFDNRLYFGAPTATPSGEFGHPDSCAFFLQRVPIPNVTPPTPPSEFSGIYKLVPGKRNDTLWNQDFTSTTDVKIPNPTGRTGYIG